MKDHVLLNVLAMVFRGAGGLVKFWKLALVAALLLSPVEPHLRWEFTYTDRGSYRVYHTCTYLGARGFITPPISECPLVIILDTRQGSL